MKTNLALAPLLVAAALMSVSAVPAFAEINNGAFQKSAEGLRLKECNDLKSQFSFYQTQMDKYPKGSTLHQEARKAANEFLGTAWERGCSWAG